MHHIFTLSTYACLQPLGTQCTTSLHCQHMHVYSPYGLSAPHLYIVNICMFTAPRDSVHHIFTLSTYACLQPLGTQCTTSLHCKSLFTATRESVHHIFTLSMSCYSPFRDSVHHILSMCPLGNQCAMLYHCQCLFTAPQGLTHHISPLSMSVYNPSWIDAPYLTIVNVCLQPLRD